MKTNRWPNWKHVQRTTEEQKDLTQEQKDLTRIAKHACSFDAGKRPEAKFLLMLIPTLMPKPSNSNSSKNGKDKEERRLSAPRIDAKKNTLAVTCRTSMPLENGNRDYRGIREGDLFSFALL
mmetsp:Transcript_35198/g.65206  ORF Transcript_35198/g.65206 Transcript_35198/m.65206 type:complete len:122 (+) Transcript_35198:225-590(+)